MFILASIKKCFVQIICFSWQAEYIIQHPRLPVRIYSVHRGDGKLGEGVFTELEWGV